MTYKGSRDGRYGVWFADGAMERMLIPEDVAWDSDALTQHAAPLINAARDAHLEDLVDDLRPGSPAHEQVRHFARDALRRAAAMPDADASTAAAPAETTHSSADGLVALSTRGYHVTRIEVVRTGESTARNVAAAIVAAVNQTPSPSGSHTADELLETAAQLTAEDLDTEMLALAERIRHLPRYP